MRRDGRRDTLSEAEAMARGQEPRGEWRVLLRLFPYLRPYFRKLVLVQPFAGSETALQDHLANGGCRCIGAGDVGCGCRCLIEWCHGCKMTCFTRRDKRDLSGIYPKQSKNG